MGYCRHPAGRVGDVGTQVCNYRNYLCNYFLLFKNVFYFYLLIDLFFVIFSSVVLTQ